MAGFIKSIHIQGFKKFDDFRIELNRNMNILVGENEAGKSTILEAIRLVLNQDYRNTDKVILEDLFNRDMVDVFSKNPLLDNLPEIKIELVLSIDDTDKNSQFFSGEHNEKGKILSGISFRCYFDVEQWGNIVDWSNLHEVPYEYYSMKWTTFSGAPYSLLRKPLNSLLLDTSRKNRNSSFNYYNRTVFNSTLDDNERLQLKNKFRAEVKRAFPTKSFGDKNQRSFGIDGKKVILENVISVLEDGIPLENHGSGMENLIKTKISLDKRTNLHLIMMEEPENHLSFLNLQSMIEMIADTQANAQVIIATHSSMIASRLGLNNVLWIAEDETHTLQNIEKDDAEFFMHLPNNNFLQLLLSPKVLLVEGPTEYLLVPEFYRQLTGHTMGDDEIGIISCNGVSFKRYLHIAETAGKKVAALTDNDSDNGKIDNIKQQNKFFCEKNLPQYVFTEEKNINLWTWEVCLFYMNREKIRCYFKEVLKPRIDVNNDDECTKYMLNHKTEMAYNLLKNQVIEKYNLTPPDYVKKAIEWLEE